MLSIYRRDDKTFTFYFYDEDGDAIDLTNCTLFVTVKQNIDDTDDNAKISSSLIIAAPASAGIATWSLVPVDTQYMAGLYHFDIQLKNSAGKITTVIKDLFEVIPDVTVRTV